MNRKGDLYTIPYQCMKLHIHKNAEFFSITRKIIHFKRIREVAVGYLVPNSLMIDGTCSEIARKLVHYIFKVLFTLFSDWCLQIWRTSFAYYSGEKTRLIYFGYNRMLTLEGLCFI